MFLAKNRFKTILIAVIIISLLFSSKNYINSSENIDNLAYVMGIGIDVGETSKYKISIQVSTIASSNNQSESSSGSSDSNSSSEPSSSSNYIISTIDCDSIDKAIAILNSYIDKEINLSYCKVLIVSEEIAKQGIKPLVNSLINKVEIRPDCNIIVSKVPTEEFIDSYAPQMEETLAKYYEVISNNNTDNAYTQTVELSDFYYQLNDSFSEPYATLGHITNPEANTSNSYNTSSLDEQAKSIRNNSKELLIETSGLAVFKNDALVGYLDSIDTIAHLLTINKLNNCIISVPSPFAENENIDIYLSSLKKTKVKSKIINGSPYIAATYDVSLRILSFNNNLTILNQDMLAEIENAANQYLTNCLYNYFNKTSKEFNCDIAGIGKKAASNFRTLEEWYNYNWLDNYKNSTFKVDIKMSIKPGYVLTEE